MELFRITRKEHSQDISGEGAFKYGGRWNSPGSRMLYTSSSRSLAILEILVHWQQPDPPPGFVVMVLFVPDRLVSKNVVATPPDWQQDQAWTREAGDRWITEKPTLLLRVPSVVVPAEPNYLVNPLHPDASEIRVVATEPLGFDKRLFVFN